MRTDHHLLQNGQASVHKRARGSLGRLKRHWRRDKDTWASYIGIILALTPNPLRCHDSFFFKLFLSPFHRPATHAPACTNPAPNPRYGREHAYTCSVPTVSTTIKLRFAHIPFMLCKRVNSGVRVEKFAFKFLPSSFIDPTPPTTTIPLSWIVSSLSTFPSLILFPLLDGVYSMKPNTRVALI
jgi:hypothetical protein